MNATLYELADMRETLDRLLEESEGELTPDMEAVLDAIDGKFDEKAERVALYIVEQLSHGKALKAEEERLAERRKGRERRADSLKAYLHAQMERVGKTKVDGLLCTVAIQNNPASVKEVVASTEEDLRNVAMIAPEFVTRVPEQFTWNKRAILDRAKVGALPEDIIKRIVIVQTKSLRIR